MESPGAISNRGQKTNIPSRNRETFISPTDNAAKGFCIHIFTQFFICTDVVSSHLAIIGNNIERKMIRISMHVKKNTDKNTDTEDVDDRAIWISRNRMRSMIREGIQTVTVCFRFCLNDLIN